MYTAMLLAAAIAVPAQTYGDGRTVNPNYAEISHCVVSPIDDVELPAQEAGILKELLAKDGMPVREGDLLGRIDDTDAQARMKAATFRLEVATEKATNNSEVRSAKALIELYRAEYEEHEAINTRSPGSIPVQELRRRKVQWDKAILDAEVVDMSFKIAGIEKKEKAVEVEAVQNELARRQIVAPFEGVVVKRYRQQSEWVQPGDPVVRVVRMNRLRVEGFLNAEEYAPDQVLGAEVIITVDLVGDYEARLEGTIDHVSPLVEASGDYRVWSEVDNPPGRGGYQWLLRPGTEANMMIELKRTPNTPTR